MQDLLMNVVDRLEQLTQNLASVNERVSALEVSGATDESKRPRWRFTLKPSMGERERAHVQGGRS